MLISRILFVLFVTPNLFLLTNASSVDSEIPSTCTYRSVKIFVPDISDEDARAYSSFGQYWIQGEGNNNRTIILWTKSERLDELLLKLKQTNTQYDVAPELLCIEESLDDTTVKFSEDFLETSRDLNVQPKSQLIDGDLPSITYTLIADYKDGRVYTNLFYSLKVVTDSGTKRLTLAKGNYFVLGGPKSKKGRWSFEKSDVDGLYLLRNRAALKYDEVVLDAGCFPDQVDKPCLAYNPIISQSGSANQLKFKLTTTSSTGIHIYANDGSNENCLKYVEHARDLFQIVLSEDNLDCAIFIPTLQTSKVHRRKFYQYIFPSVDQTRRLKFHEGVISAGSANVTTEINTCFIASENLGRFSIDVSYDNERISPYNKDIMGLVNTFFPDIETYNRTGDNVTCLWNRTPKSKVQFTSPQNTVTKIALLFTEYNNYEIPFSEKGEKFIIADALLKCENFPCTRVLKQRLPTSLTMAVSGSSTYEIARGKMVITSGFGFDYVTSDGLESQTPPSPDC